MNTAQDINDSVLHMKRRGDSFAVATVVRTLSMTAAKPGAKAIIDHTGDVVEGWIGGGCARSAVIKAAIRAIEDGEPRLVLIHPEEVLQEQGLDKGESVDGRWVAGNMCPSKGSMEIFIEPFLAHPELIVVGKTPVAQSMCQLAPNFNFTVAVMGGFSNTTDVQTDEYEQLTQTSIGIKSYASWDRVPVENNNRFITIATQGSGDLKALSAALAVQSRHIGFVGSPRKMTHLKNSLQEQGFDVPVLQRIKGPAGMDIGAVTPQEIALSILAELVQIRRNTGHVRSLQQ